MTSAELTDWIAFERVHGPILVHDRIDVGFAQLSYLMARLWGKERRELTIRDFMPNWYREATEDDAVKQGFEKMLRIARAND